MAERMVAPGTYFQENDQSFVPTAYLAAGAALIGPTVKGPAMIPTIVSTYGEYVTIFGDKFKSGSNYYQYLTSHAAKEYLKYNSSLTVCKILAGTYSEASASVTSTGGSTSFIIHTLADGSIMNNWASESSSHFVGTNDILISGSQHNIRWEISNLNNNKGTFTLNVRRGNDSKKRKNYLETWNNLSLDPNSENYISKVIGDVDLNINGSGTTTPIIEASGSYINRSSYIRISNVLNTIDYLDENGSVRVDAASQSLPVEGSGSNWGSLGGGTDGYSGFDALGNQNGSNTSAVNFYESINATDSQGFDITAAADGLTAYSDAIYLFSNINDYDVNLLLTPGVLHDVHPTAFELAVDVCEDRGDVFFIGDLVAKGTTIATVKAEAEELDSSYVASYWPWAQIFDNINNKNVWVPMSTIMGGVIAQNDKIGFEWTAPAGFLRGGIPSIVRTERKLTMSNIGDIYESNVNPITSFPNEGYVPWGQKTLQIKPTALDRINVRRLLINLKKFIKSVTKYLVFEPNTTATRYKFLNQVNPYMNSIKEKFGLYKFEVRMDETNNTPDIIDRNILKGEIWIQPTKTSEYIAIDINITPTGAEFK